MNYALAAFCFFYIFYILYILYICESEYKVGLSHLVFDFLVEWTDSTSEDFYAMKYILTGISLDGMLVRDKIYD